MWDYEGTVDENDHGPDFKSGDLGGDVHGYSITQDGARYDESPKRLGDAAGIAAAVVASRQGQAAWMAYYQQAWPAMHQWLAALPPAERARCFDRCRRFDGIAALL